MEIMEGLTSMKSEQFRSYGMFDLSTESRLLSSGGSAGLHRDCGIIDSCSPIYRSYLRAVRFLAEQCENFFGNDPSYCVEKFIKDIIVGKVTPNHDGFVPLAPAAGGGCGDHGRVTGVWLEDKPARLVREVQRDMDLSRGESARLLGQQCFVTPCGRTLDQVRNQFFVDCFSTECVQQQQHQSSSSTTMMMGHGSMSSSSAGPMMGPGGSRMKANTTECVPVPSSEHVAEIVGKKGGKIKNIRAETNTYIKTPKRDEEPVFVITGRKEDVALAKQKITAAADHFTQLREARRQNPGAVCVGSVSVGGGGSGSSCTGSLGGVGPLGPPKRDGDITVSVEVPYEFVGLVVGQKGATIKRIQQDTNTYITTPSRRHRPIFEVVGQPLEVERAREAIRAHINSRVEKFRAEAATPGGSVVGLGIGGGGGCSYGSSGLGSASGMFGGVASASSPFMSGSSGVYDDFFLGATDSAPSLAEPAADLTSSYGTSWSTATGSSGSSCGSGSSRAFAPGGGGGGVGGGGGRLSAFRQLPVDLISDPTAPLGACFKELSLLGGSSGAGGDTGTTAAGATTGYWQAPERATCHSLPPASSSFGSGSADPADPLCRRLSEGGARAVGSVLFSLGDQLGWAGCSSRSLYSCSSSIGGGGGLEDVSAATVVGDAAGAAGSSETLNSDSGVELASPPPSSLLLDSVGSGAIMSGANFGPIGSKRSSPTSVSSSSD